MRFCTLRMIAAIAFLTAGRTACWDDKNRQQPPTPGEISRAADKALEQVIQGRLPAGKTVFGDDASVFGRHTVPANLAIDSPEYTVEYLMTANTNHATPSLTIYRRYDRGAGNHLQLSRGADGRWAIIGWGNFQTDTVEDVDAKGGDHERRKKYIMEIFQAATACAEDKSC